MNTLAAIRDSGKPSQRLYRDTHDTFEEYCRDRWGFSKVRATQFITASKRYSALETVTIVTVLPSSESQVRELTRCESDDQAAEVWQQVVDGLCDRVTFSQLSATQRAMVGAKLATLKNGQKKTDRAGQNCPPQSNDDAASLLGVSPRSIKTAKQVIDSKSKPLIEAVESDDELIETQGDPWAYVWSSMMRKNHSESQLSFYAAGWRKLNGLKKAGRPKKSKVNNRCNDAPIKKTNDTAGNKFGISGRTVAKAANVLEKGCEQLQQAVKDGRMVGTVDRPEWIAADVCGVLGIEDAKGQLKRFKATEKGMANCPTLGGQLVRTVYISAFGS